MSASSEADEATQFTLLTEWLTATLQGPELDICLLDEIVAQFKSGTILDDSSIRDFSILLGSSDHFNRLRLGHGAFINIVAILLHLPYSHYQEKVLFAFMRTIELFKNPKAIQSIMKRNGHLPGSTEEIQAKHHKIYDKLIHKMMQVLVHDEQEPSMRLMAGHILYALVNGNNEAQQIARQRTEISTLGPLIDNDENYVLRVFVANIVREMCATSSELHEFWPQIPKKKKDRYGDFPVAMTPESAWLGSVADYLSSKDINRGFQGDSQAIVSKLLSIDTGTHTFEDIPGGNILAVIAEKFIFIIPGTSTKPLVKLELELDSGCQCFVDELTSPENQFDSGDDVNVKIRAPGKGHQVFEGTRSALDLAILVLSQYKQGEIFADHASRSLQLMSLSPRHGDLSVDTEGSSRAESRSFRRLDVGMIDMSMEDDLECDNSSIIGVDTNIKRQKLSRSRSRQSSRVTEAKLTEAQRQMVSASVQSASQRSLRHDQRQGLPIQSRSIDPRVLTKRTSDDVQADVTTDFGTSLDFESYVEQSKSQTEDEPGRRAKAVEPPAGALPDVIPTQHIESSPSNRARRTSLKRHLEVTEGNVNNRPPHQSLRPFRPLVQGSILTNTSEHHEPVEPHLVDADTKLGMVIRKIPATNDKESAKQPSMPRGARQRTQKSQSGAVGSTDWDGGDMADENSVLPAAKKPRLTRPAAKAASRQSQGPAQIPTETTQLSDSGATSMLKRPKATITKAQRPQRTYSPAQYDEFEIEDEEDTVAPACEGGIPTTKRATKGGRNIKSQAPKPAKGAFTKSNTRQRKALQHLVTNASLASNRPRRSRPKSKKYIAESGSEAERSNKDVEEIVDKAIGDTVAGEENTIADHELQWPATPALRHQRTDEVAPGPIISERSNEAQSNDGVAVASQFPIRRVPGATEIAKNYETLVAASPKRPDEADMSGLANECDEAPGLRETEKQDANLQKTSTDADGDDSLAEVAEDSYPKVATTKSEVSRKSFGSKLGQAIQSIAPHQARADTNATHTTPLSNAKLFVGAVNQVSSSSLKKPTKSTTARISEGGNAPPSGLAARPRKLKENAVGEKHMALPAKTTKQAADQSNDTTKAIKKPADVSHNPQQAKLEPSDSRKLPDNLNSTLNVHSTISRKVTAPVTPSVQQVAEVNQPASVSEGAGTLHGDGRGHTDQRALQLPDTNTTIDLTQDSNEATSVAGLDPIDQLQDDKEGIETAGATIPRISQRRAHRVISSARPDGQVSNQSTLLLQAHSPVPGDSDLARTPQQPKLPTMRGSSRRPDLVAFKGKASASREITKKSQLVHFDTRGPQNQGISSPGKQTEKSTAAFSYTPDAQKDMNYKKSRFAAAKRNPFVEAPTPQIESVDAADEVDHDHSGIIVEDDMDMAKSDEIMYGRHEYPVSEESAHARGCHNPSEVLKAVTSGSQSSRVDHNGSPRLLSTHLDLSTQPDGSVMNQAEVIASESSDIEEDLTASTESTSEPEGRASQESDQSFRLTNEAPLPRQSDSGIRSRAQATSTVTSHLNAVKESERRQAPTTAMIKSVPRESLGLSKMIQEQYPDASNAVATDVFRKPAFKTTVSKLLAASTEIPVANTRVSAPAPIAHRQPLTDLSDNQKQVAVTEESSPNYSTEYSSAAAPDLFIKPQHKNPVQQHPAFDSLRAAPGSLRTTLHMAHADRMVEKEATILEDLNRAKNIQQATKDADRTLVEGDSIHQHRHRQSSLKSAVGHISAPLNVERNITSCQDDIRWRDGARNAQRKIRDALVDIADTVLIRLDNEEKAIERRVVNYDTGCKNIVSKFQESQTNSMQRARQQALEMATARSAKVSATFDRLQEIKRDARNRDAEPLLQQAIKNKGNVLTKQIEEMLKEKREKIAAE